jgi:hypothetical protein
VLAFGEVRAAQTMLPCGSVLKKPVSRRSDRRKNDEDIAERITGGVRIDRSSQTRRRERPVAHDQSRLPEEGRDRGERRRNH